VNVYLICKARGMDCDQKTLKQPINVPVDTDLYRLVEDYEYIWSRPLAPEATENLDPLFRSSAKRARSTKKFKSGKPLCLYNRIRIPAGFTYDGASVPRIAWSITGIRPDGLLRAAAAVHDWIYHWSGDLPAGSQTFCVDGMEWKNAIGTWKRKDCDRLFGRMLREAGVPSLKRKMAYIAVRLMGGLSWD